MLLLLFFTIRENALNTFLLYLLHKFTTSTKNKKERTSLFTPSLLIQSSHPPVSVKIIKY